ncbi:hypothetical protein [Vibrio mediterranei]|uniref:hypothetical protein n=1 Tax=Vibrio mediterranei TaxID=689 RepID=UPI00148CB8EC|nr:hypothetical protein [Vibrio mediterranei]NOI22884.1 hypothetical protein [Vibrio mediterranei]
MKIDWQVPDARSGFMGKIDRLIGPGATVAEKRLQLYIPFLAGFAVVFYSVLVPLNWSWEQMLVAGLLTIDIVGGIITNATSSAKRWFHREGEGFKQHMTFIAIHFVQLTLFSWMFLDMNPVWVLMVGGYMMLACVWILRTPLYLQRPVALCFYALSILLSLYVFETPRGLEWFLPLFYLKLLISHILREEPYRPDNESTSQSQEEVNNER